MNGLDKNRNGFTIIELIVVIVVIAILAAITIVSYTGVSARAKTSKASGEAAMILKKLETYRTTNNSTLPLSSQDWVSLSDLASSSSETQLPPNLRVVRATDNTADASISDYYAVSTASAGSPSVYIFIACTSGGGIVGQKVAYPDFVTKTIKFVRSATC